MAPVCSLTEETLQRIFDLVHDPRNPSEMLSAALVRRSWRRPAQHVLFASTAVVVRSYRPSSSTRQKAAPWVEIGSRRGLITKSVEVYSKAKGSAAGVFGLRELAWCAGVRELTLDSVKAGAHIWDQTVFQNLEHLSVVNVDLPASAHNSHDPASSLSQILPVGSINLKLKKLDVTDSFRWLAAFLENYADRLALEVLHVTSTGREVEIFNSLDGRKIGSNLEKLAPTLRRSSLTLLQFSPDAPALLKVLPAMTQFALHLDYSSRPVLIPKSLSRLPSSITHLTIARNRDSSIGEHFPFNKIPFQDLVLLLSSLPSLSIFELPDCMASYILGCEGSADVVAECRRRSIRIRCYEGYV